LENAHKNAEATKIANPSTDSQLSVLKVLETAVDKEFAPLTFLHLALLLLQICQSLMLALALEKL